MPTDADRDVLLSDEILQLAAVSASSIITGSPYNDWMNGTPDADTILGLDGDDFMQGRGGADLLDGGAGSDTASYAESTAAVTIDLATGAISGGHATGDTFVSIENLIGSNFGDILTGDSGANTLNGGAGVDILTGGDGNDIYYVDNVGDLVIETEDAGVDEVVSLLATYTLGGNLENLTFLQLLLC